MARRRRPPPEVGELDGANAWRRARYLWTRGRFHPEVGRLLPDWPSGGGLPVAQVEEAWRAAGVDPPTGGGRVTR